MVQTIGMIFIYAGLGFITFGVIGLYRFNHFYPRILVASKIDTVGFINVMIGVMLRNGLSSFTLKVGLILVLSLIINPLITHSIARSAYNSGYKIRKE